MASFVLNFVGSAAMRPSMITVGHFQTGGVPAYFRDGQRRLCRVA